MSQSVEWFAINRMVWGSESQWKTDFPHFSRLALGPIKPPKQDLFSGYKGDGLWCLSNSPSSAKVKESVKLYLYSWDSCLFISLLLSGSSWSLLGRTLSFYVYSFKRNYFSLASNLKTLIWLQKMYTPSANAAEEPRNKLIYLHNYLVLPHVYTLCSSNQVNSVHADWKIVTKYFFLLPQNQNNSFHKVSHHLAGPIVSTQFGPSPGYLATGAHS